jgi:hypothetical protein
MRSARLLEFARECEPICLEMVCLPGYAGAMTSIHREIRMRIPVLAILTLLAVLSAVPAKAQTYGGNFPVCLQIYLRDGARNIECSYSSMEQCRATASGLSAMCLINPYYANAREPAYRQPRRVTRSDAGARLPDTWIDLGQ